MLNNKSIFRRAKRTDPNRREYIPEADELLYTHRNGHVKGIFKHILNSFESKVTRVRLAALMPDFAILPHVDYDPSYITRYHIPIFTNPEVLFGVQNKSEEHRFHLPSDGSVYFINTGLKHWVENKGASPRLHLIVDTHGQKDLVFV